MVFRIFFSFFLKIFQEDESQIYNGDSLTKFKILFSSNMDDGRSDRTPDETREREFTNK